MEAGEPDGRGAHVDAPASGAEVEGHADDVDGTHRRTDKGHGGARPPDSISREFGDFNKRMIVCDLRRWLEA